MSGRKEAFCRAPRRAHKFGTLADPRLKAVGYGSYAGYAADETRYFNPGWIFSTSFSKRIEIPFVTTICFR